MVDYTKTMDGILGELFESPEVKRKKAGQKQRTARRLFISDIKKTTGRMNTPIYASDSGADVLIEAGQIVNNAAHKLRYDKFDSTENQAQEVARLYGGFLLGLKAIRNSKEEIPKYEVDSFIRTATKEFTENYKKIKEVSGDYLGLARDPLYFLEEASRKGLEGDFSYTKNKDTLQREFENKGVDFSRNQKSGGLEKATGAVSVIALVGGAFFFSTSVTGNVIGLSNGTSSIIGAVLLVIGFVAGYFWAKGKRNNRRK